MNSRERTGDEGSLGGFVAHLDLEGTPYARFKNTQAYRDIENKPYFYLIKVNDCNIHKTIKIGISANSNPRARLREYELFYSGQFRVVLILTFAQWKQGRNSGYMEYRGKEPLQQRFETELKRRLKGAVDRGSEWYSVSKQRYVLDNIWNLRQDKNFTKHIPFSNPERMSRRQRGLNPDN